MGRYQNLLLKAALVSIFSGLAVPLHAAAPTTTGSDLYVCNKGSVAVEVVSATRGQDLLHGGRYYWVIDGTTAVPGNCAHVKNMDGNPAYIAFGFADSKGEWGAGRISQVPDLGSTAFGFFRKTEKIITAAMKTMCVRQDATHYALNDDFSIDCHFTLTGQAANIGQGPLVTLTSALYFAEDIQFCDAYTAFDGTTSRPDYCDPTHYYLNISPSATDRELHATKGTKGGSDAVEEPSICGKVSCMDQFLQGLAQALKDSADQRTANTSAVRPHAPAIPPPSPPPPPRAAQPMWPKDDDDPIGSGGFVTRPTAPAPALGGRGGRGQANPLPWVRTDIPAYIEASKTGFAAYKMGDAQISQDLRMWTSSVKPSAARGCWVVQGATSTTLSCALTPAGDLNRLRPYYTELNREITAALSRDWTQVEQPFGGDLPSHGYQSPTGAHLEVWIMPAESGGAYEIHFQLVSAH